MGGRVRGNSDVAENFDPRPGAVWQLMAGPVDHLGDGPAVLIENSRFVALGNPPAGECDHDAPALPTEPLIGCVVSGVDRDNRHVAD